MPTNTNPWLPTDFEEIPLLARPLVRERAEWKIYLVFAGRVIATQGSHPIVSVGLEQHSSFWSHPYARAQRTIEYAMRTFFGPDMPGVTQEIRDLHRDIKGLDYDGRPYHAWNREAWTWVHLTVVEALIVALETFHGRLPEHDRTAIIAETRQVGRLYGVRDADMPNDYAGLRAYVDHGIAHTLANTPVSKRLQETLRKPPAPSRAVATVWPLIRWPAGNVVPTLVYGAFPPAVREMWGVRWTTIDEAKYRAMIRALGAATAGLPDRLSMMPYAYRAIKRAENEQLSLIPR